MSDDKKKLLRLEKRLKELEGRFYDGCEWGFEDCNCGVTEDIPTEKLLGLILHHLGLKAEKQEAKYILKKK